MSLPIRSALLLPLAAAAACDTPAGSAAAGGPDTGAACGVLAGPCPKGWYCLDGRCRAGLPDATAGDAADAGDGAVAAVCLPACSGAQVCGAGGECLEPERCESDDDCLPGRVCFADRRCADVCRPAVCPRRGLCARSRCEPPRPCAGDGDCPRGTTCDAQRCVPPCVADEDCPGRQTCGADGLCREASPCRSHQDCRPDRECRDGRCEPPPPPACTAEDASACGQGACGPGGVCGPRRVCADDGECAGLLCGASGLCVPYRADKNCPRTQRCETGRPEGARCTEPERCVADEDCVGVRVCAPTGGCADPAGCEEDRMSGNHDATRAAALEDALASGLRLCPGTEDWFSLQRGGEFGLEVVLQDADGAGLVLELYDEARPEAPLMRADAPGPSERVGVSGAADARSLLLRVSGPPGAAGPYSLDVRWLSREVCVDDPAEDWGGDDGARDATPLLAGEGQVVGRRYCTGADWFRLQTARPAVLEVEVASESGEALLTLGAVTATGEPLGEAAVAGPELAAHGLTAGTYYVYVAGIGDERAAYVLEWRWRQDSAHLRNRCRQAPLVAPGGLWEGRLPDDAPDEVRGVCAPDGPSGREAMARVEVEEVTDLVVRVESADFEPVVYARRDCALASSEVGCGLGELQADQVDATTWYLLLDGVAAGARGRFSARVLTGDLVTPGDPGRCDRAAWLDPDESGVFAVVGDTTGGQADAPPAGCAPFGSTGEAPDAWYMMETDEDHWLLAEVEPEDFDAVLHLRTGQCGATTELSCADEPPRISVPLLPAGVHFLVVDGFEPGEEGRFVLRGQLSPAPDPPDNDSCDQALLLVPDADGRTRVAGDTLVATDRGEVSCAQAPSRLAPDLFYRVTLAGRSDVRVRVSPDVDYAPAVALRTGSCRDGVELVCAAEAPWAVAAAGLAAGDYLIVLDGGRPTARGAFDLELEVDPVE